MVFLSQVDIQSQGCIAVGSTAKLSDLRKIKLLEMARNERKVTKIVTTKGTTDRGD